MSRLRSTEILLVALAAVACTTIVGLPDLPEQATSGAAGKAGSGASGGASPSGGVSGAGGSVAGAQSSGGKGSGGSLSTGGTGAEGGDDSGGTSNTGGSGLGGTPSTGGTTGGTDGTGGSAGSAGSGGSDGAGGNAGTGGMGSGGDVGSGGNGGSGGGAGNGGSGGDAGSGAAAGTGGGTGGTAGNGGTAGTGGTTPDPIVGPCDIFAEGNTPCVAAYSTIRLLRGDYSGPLYQVRADSSAMNTGSGGTLHDIGARSDGFADADAHDVHCSGTICTISRLYDQSGRGNDLTVAKAGLPDGGTYAAMDDFESVANAGPLTVDGVGVYSLYMDTRQGYRLAAAGAGMPRGTAAQGIYMLADGTRQNATACCWEFGNVTTDPKTYKGVTSLFFGTAFWGRGGGTGPWFMADFGGGIWAGGSMAGDPGWGELNGPFTANTNNPTLNVPFAIGFLKTNASNYSLRMANVATASSLTTGYDGALPRTLNHEGGIVLGVGATNDNNSRGTFYEGAIVAGYPMDDVELEVLQNVKAAGYGQ